LGPLEKRWGNVAFDDVTATFSGEVSVQGEQTTTFSADAQGYKAVVRAVGCFLIASMPDDGLEEAIENLSDVYQYWREQSTLPSPESRTKVLAGVVESKSERPSILISD